MYYYNMQQQRAHPPVMKKAGEKIKYLTMFHVNNFLFIFFLLLLLYIFFLFIFSLIDQFKQKYICFSKYYLFRFFIYGI